MIAVTTPDTIPCRVKGVFCYRYTPYRNVSFCIDELIKIIQDIERRQILVDEYRNNNQRKQKTYGILLHSIGRRTGFKSVYRILPELISKGYIHDEYTSRSTSYSALPRTESTIPTPIMIIPSLHAGTNQL
ncbi:hypothetical protein Pst134EA_007672 [Puccinia striiformis f. sp. tritici]|uniref:hypothetical protein n=1 Tax=Puccinia striiformis f. sp. tritici TaxID=168172 RepID=UPI0020088673|nr:hypothetical protein Pst134EA_007672 [Puccinia striiformis f. sp. tritici]KAH9460598.1 hypothetical protein Pst134EB_008763 [Puccinia striiformis f. sp. tritici]KAH9470414.1 hypothetical protein Pst134EA_007672 [Puccinia striiformis f. sp. tritici]